MSIKLPDFLAWPSLNRLRDRMGAPLVERFGAQQAGASDRVSLRERLEQTGLDVTSDQIEVLADGTLAYQGYRVLVYIRDVNNAAYLPRYHLAHCQTLETMYRNRRAERYVVANSDSGLFHVNIKDEGRAGPMRLDVCQNCLDHIGWQGFSSQLPRADRLARVGQFALKDFFTQYPRDLHARTPRHSAETAPRNEYAPDWADISKRTRDQRGYRCQKCGITLANADSHLMHVHHRNGLKYDNAPGNLEVLCIGCHADEPMHGHLKDQDAYRAFTARYRESP